MKSSGVVLLRHLLLCPLLVLTGCAQEVDDSGWTVSKLGSPAIQRQDDGSTEIVGSAGISGVYFRRTDLRQDKVYRLVISGTPHSGRTVLGIKRDDGPFAYATAPDGTLDLFVFETTSIKVLVHGELPFSYRTKLAISECPDCMTDARLRDIVRAAIPGIDAKLKSDPLPAIDQLLHWASSVVDLGGDIPEFTNLKQAFSLMSASQLYSEVWLPDAGGASCAGFAVFFQKLLAVFGAPAFTIDIGYAGTFLAHVTTVVPIKSASKTRFYLFDPTFGGTYRARQNGAYADVELVLDGSVPAVFTARTIPRTVMHAANVAERAREVFAQLGVSPECDTPSGGAYTRCKEIPYDFRYVLIGWSEALIERSIPLDADLILTFMRKQVFSVSDTAGAGPRQEFLAMIARTTRRN